MKASSDESDFESVDGARFESVVQAFDKGVEITEELVIKKVAEILANRGKRACSIPEQNQLLDQVCKKIGQCFAVNFSIYIISIFLVFNFAVLFLTYRGDAF